MLTGIQVRRSWRPQPWNIQMENRSVRTRMIFHHRRSVHFLDSTMQCNVCFCLAHFCILAIIAVNQCAGFITCRLEPRGPCGYWTKRWLMGARGTCLSNVRSSEFIHWDCFTQWQKVSYYKRFKKFCCYRNEASSASSYLQWNVLGESDLWGWSSYPTFSETCFASIITVDVMHVTCLDLLILRI